MIFVVSAIALRWCELLKCFCKLFASRKMAGGALPVQLKWYDVEIARQGGIIYLDEQIFKG